MLLLVHIPSRMVNELVGPVKDVGNEVSSVLGLQILITCGTCGLQCRVQYSVADMNTAYNEGECVSLTHTPYISSDGRPRQA